MKKTGIWDQCGWRYQLSMGEMATRAAAPNARAARRRSTRSACARVHAPQKPLRDETAAPRGSWRARRRRSQARARRRLVSMLFSSQQLPGAVIGRLSPHSCGTSKGTLEAPAMSRVRDDASAAGHRVAPLVEIKDVARRLPFLELGVGGAEALRIRSLASSLAPPLHGRRHRTADGQRARLAHERAPAGRARLGIGAPRAQQGPVVLGELDAGVPREGAGVVAARRACGTELSRNGGHHRRGS